MKNNKRLCFFVFYCLLLFAAFWRVEAALVRISLGNSLSSYVLIIPAISGALLYWHRKTLTIGPCRYSFVTVFLLFGIMGLLGALSLEGGGFHLDMINGLPALVFALTSFFIAGFAGFLGSEAFFAARFPLLFLYLMVPLPVWIETPLTMMLQYGSAAVAYGLMKLTIFPLYWEDTTVFNLPGITIHVAEECSGIRSTLVLLITTVLTSHLMLRTNKARLILVLLALLIGIFRNAFRIWILALLTVYVDPNALSGSLHHQGGPFFFALALILLFSMTYILSRTETKAARRKDIHD